MRNLFLALALLATLPGAWAQGQAERKAIDVTVVNGQIVVEEEVARTSRNEGAVLWRMATAGYVFPANGIVIDAVGKHSCAVVANGRMFRCAKLGHDSGARYKYVVNAVNSQSGQALQPLDPWLEYD